MTGPFSAIRPCGFDPAPLDTDDDFYSEDTDHVPSLPPVNEQRRPDAHPDAA